VQVHQGPLEALPRCLTALTAGGCAAAAAAADDILALLLLLLVDMQVP
jgi:hypothetical protein